ncbi:MAG: phosphatidylserine decarboxylase [Campylobacterales bacterium]|nr:phosphatidylserine decarboxylase [Campylobacterales bacterium]
MKNNLLPIAKCGVPYISYALLLFIVFFIVDFEFLALVSFVAAFFFVYIFRNPEREIKYFGDLSVVSPVDGVVLNIEELSDDLDGYRYKIKVDNSYGDLALLRAPFDATVTKVLLNRGAKLSSRLELAKKLNENLSVVFQDAKSNKLKVSHTLKQSFVDIDTDLINNQKIAHSTRYATMVNGIVLIYLPENFRLNLKKGDELKASSSLIGYFS